MNFISLFAGIGGFDLGFERVGMACEGQVEIDGACNKILKKHWPNVKRYGDVKECGKHNLEQVDLICGGFPCQDVSVAGRREGLAGSRSGLWFEFYRVLEELRPGWVVIENVPGLLSSNKGRDFATILQGLAELRYLSAWRILDAQYFGVAQRRRRVFIIGHLGDGRAAQVLFEPTCGPRDTPPSRETGARVTPFAPGGFGEYREGLTTLRVGGGNDSQGLLAWHENKGGELTPSDHMKASQSGASHSYQGIAYQTIIFDPRSQDGIPRIYGSVDMAVVPPLNTAQGGQRQSCVVYQESQYGVKKYNEAGSLRSGRIPEHQMLVRQVASTLVSPHKQWNSAQALPNLQTTKYGVRRLTPVECERLQGFPDNWTAGQSDTKRYKQLGNAVCVPVIEWLGRRIIKNS